MFITGTNLLRAYMHGFFIDIRLYRKAKSVAEPFAFEEYRKRKIREKIEEERVNRVQLQVTVMVQHVVEYTSRNISYITLGKTIGISFILVF